MPKITGTHGKIVSVQLLGVGETIRQLRAAGKEIENGADLGVVKAAAFVEEEVKESISGRRAESQSVDTGHFVGDVKISKLKKAEAKVHAPNTPYANVLEYGGAGRQPRNHFRNTKSRTQRDVRDIIKKETRI